MNLLLHCFDESSCSLDILCETLREQGSGNISIMNSFYSKSIYDTCRKNNIEITDAGWFLAIQNELVTPSSEQGETASNGGGTREPFLFYGLPLQCLHQRYIWGVATKKPAE